jgi:galactose mutarotase-like enzyme
MWDAGAVDTVTLSSEDGRIAAKFVPEANMLGCSLTRDGEELLDTGRGVSAYVERGKTMGIPLLHPWANRLAGFECRVADKTLSLPADDTRIPLDPSGLPIHGVLPALPRWRLDSEVNGSRLLARMDWSSPELLELFPFVHELQLEAIVDGSGLTITTTLRATADDVVPVSFGYHPYLRLPGSSRREWHIRLPAFRRLRVDERMIPTGEREALSPREFRLGDMSWDDGLDALTVPAEFEVTAGGRTLALTFLEGFNFAQVYAPPDKDFICFEPMTAPTNALNSGDGLTLVTPGEEYRTAFAIRVS